MDSNDNPSGSHLLENSNVNNPYVDSQSLSRNNIIFSIIIRINYTLKIKNILYHMKSP
jgi:hypothetical protein